MKYSNTITIAGINVNLGLEYQSAHEYFLEYENTETEPCLSVCVDDEAWGEAFRNGFHKDGELEASIIVMRVSDALLKYQACLMHAVAFLFHGRAWLISAEPGVGKSTQIKYLMDMYPGEFSVICGDRPALQFCDNGLIMVHPTPWNGKEGWKGASAAPLAGILCLQRADNTSIKKLKKRDAVIPVLKSLITMRESTEIINELSKLEAKLIDSVPVYQYCNGGVPNSTEVLYNFLSGGRY